MLFANDIWPASYAVSDFLCSHKSLVVNRLVLELGAGAALPSVVASKLGARFVVSTDYPAKDIIENIDRVFVHNNIRENYAAVGYIWGKDENVLQENTSGKSGFDLLILADLLWKDTYDCHEELVTCIDRLLSADGIAVVAFVHRSSPSHNIEKDMEFFTRCEAHDLNYDLEERCNKYEDIYSEGSPVEVLIYSVSKKSAVDKEKCH